ncbi:MAG: multidrug effflux MFS transporter [Saccharospirillum sp.]
MTTAETPGAERPAALRLPEFVALMALMTSLVAMSIDTMLPALPIIGQDLGAADIAQTQLIISFVILGMGIGQLFFGPLSDAVGRKPTILAGLALFIAGSAVSMLADSMEVMLLGRLIQGFGVSGPRIVTIALIRDQFVGRAMAQVMSFIMTVFILVPMLAPAVGQGVVLLSHWRGIFAVFIALALVVGLWFALRQPETLMPDKRQPVSLRNLWHSTRFVLTQPTTLWFVTSAGFVFGSFLTYLGSAQAIFVDLYDVGLRFPLYFAIMAGVIGLSSFTNGKLVHRFGMTRISYMALSGFIGSFGVLLVLAVFQGGIPPLWQFMVFGCLGFFWVGLMFGNFNALAMKPLGAVAGIGAALVGSLTNFISVPLSIVAGLFYNQTLVPLLLVFVAFGIASLFCAHRGLAHFEDD